MNTHVAKRHTRARAPSPSRRARDAMASISFSRSTPIPRVARRTSRARVSSRASRDDEARRMDSLDAVLRSTPTPNPPTTRAQEERESPPPPARVTREVEVALSADAAARVTLTVRNATSRLVRATMRSPLGVVFEDVDGDIVVVEFYDESELGPRGRGIEIGDVLRATSAMTPTMEYPKLNVIGGGVGRPGWRRVMYTCACAEDGNLDDVTFDQAMKAIGSNAKAGDYDVELVFERFGG